MTSVPDHRVTVDSVPAVAALFVTAVNAEHLMTSVTSLRAEGIHMVAGGPSDDALAAYQESGCECIGAEDIAELVNMTWRLHQLPILVVGDAITVGGNFLGRAFEIMADDIRVASVSFFSNDAGFLSFPNGSAPDSSPSDQDADSVTRLLRRLGPQSLPAPIPGASGAAVLLSASALSMIGDLRIGPRGEMPGVLADFSARTRARGFVHVLDSSTFYGRNRALGDSPQSIGPNDDMDPDDRQWFHTSHPNEATFIEHETSSPTSPLALALGLARTKVLGLRIVVDGSYLGPSEMGTQVSILATVESLSRRHDVREVIVALKEEPPAYAAFVFSLPKVVARVVDFETLEGLPRCDIAHRPVQPDQWFSPDRWRRVADRVVVTVLDLIAFRNSAYYPNAGEWLSFREVMREGLRGADAVVAISNDVKRQIEAERFRVDPDRLHAIPFGTEHLHGDESEEIPPELETRGLDHPFILCLGTDFLHKNRDIAIAVLAELRKRGHAHSLVLAGLAVPFGSSRASEETMLLHEAAAVRPDVYFLPDVPSSQRNWLLRHADLVLYPSSAEGFGFVPYEAARFGTPAVFTSFGPLRELAPDIPVAASDWSPEALAAAADLLLSDSSQSRLQVESSLNAGSKYTWAAYAERLTELHRHVMTLAPVASVVPNEPPSGELQQLRLEFAQYRAEQEQMQASSAFRFASRLRALSHVLRVGRSSGPA